MANAENAAGGIGVDIKSAKELLSAGVNVLTSGNHIWKKKEIYSFLDEHEKLIRPANYPAGAPGRAGALAAKRPQSHRHQYSGARLYAQSRRRSVSLR